jgi:N-acetyl-gamma-glutamyl-phosphate reductase
MAIGNSERVNVAIVGVSGYAGGELARLLSRHPHVRVAYAASSTYAGKPLAKAFPGLHGTDAGRVVCEHFDAGHAGVTADIIFLAQDSGKAMHVARQLLDMGKRVVDLSADFRLRNVETYEHWYKIEHEASLLLEGAAIYGLPETNREYIKGAKLIANPGCYPTASILGLAPLLSHKLVKPTGIIVDAKSGVSGAGRVKTDAAYRFSEANESLLPYGVGGVHRHTPEIEQELSVHAAPHNVTLSFTPHLVPMTRGLLATCYADLTNNATTTADVLNALRTFYAPSPFVVVRDAGDFPATKDVYGSNFCHIGAVVDNRTHRVVVTSVIDNLVKGAAGQAVQNMNLMLGLPETTGLESGALWP